MKAAVYCGTRNVYQDMIPSMKSLLIHSDVDKIYFLIEDDEFPYELPPEVECINVSNQKFFPPDGPNMKNRCSYMVLLRAAFAKIFPNLDKILTIDNDTIVVQNISDLWNLPLDKYYFAGVPEYNKTNKIFNYINMGLAMINLKKLREDGKDDELIYNLNTYYYMEAEQSCFNQTCQSAIYILPKEYNSNWYTYKSENTTKTKIRHFAYTKGWQLFPLVQKYRDIELIRNQTDCYDLDIIIPYYNNKKGLQRTLSSIYYDNFPQIHITVIDDCSKDIDYLQLKTIYPRVNFIRLSENHGPGAARQIGINATNSPYIMFMDTDDIAYNTEALIHVLNIIKENNDAYVFSFGWYNEEEDKEFYNDFGYLHGSCFKREFLELYDIQFPTAPECSYCNEDLGFMQCCYLILNQIKSDERLTHIYSERKLIYTRTFDKNSLTHVLTNKKLVKGITYNTEYFIKYARAHNVFPISIADRAAYYFIQVYLYYLQCAKESPELMDYNLQYVKYYYFNIYRVYEKVTVGRLKQFYGNQMDNLIKNISPQIPKINLNQFISSLKNNTDLNEEYIKPIKDLVNNSITLLQMDIDDNISENIFLIEMNNKFVELYYYFLKSLIENPICSTKIWLLIKKYYDELYAKYLDKHGKYLNEAYLQYFKLIIKLKGLPSVKNNINHFIKELAQNNEIPPYYLR